MCCINDKVGKCLIAGIPEKLKKLGEYSIAPGCNLCSFETTLYRVL
jgi:hypothetical protein